MARRLLILDAEMRIILFFAILCCGSTVAAQHVEPPTSFVPPVWRVNSEPSVELTTLPMDWMELEREYRCVRIRRWIVLLSGGLAVTGFGVTAAWLSAWNGVASRDSFTANTRTLAFGLLAAVAFALAMIGVKRLRNAARLRTRITRRMRFLETKPIDPWR